MIKQKILKYRYLLLILFMALFFLLILPRYFFVHDQITFARWTDWIIQDGMVNIYKHNEVNYLPAYLYVLEGFGYWAKNYQTVFVNLYYLKIIPLFFDFGAVLLVYKILGKLKLPQNRILLLVLNIAFFYNTLFWGQIDSVHTFFLFLTFYLLLEKKFLFAVLAYITAINIKYQSLIYAPIILMILLPGILKNPKVILKYFFAGLGAQILLLFPYLARGGDLTILFNVIKNSVGFYPYISMNAFNLWFIVVGPGKAWTSDTQTFFFFSYRIWGYVLFGIGYILALIPLFRIFLKKLKTKELFDWKNLNVIALSFILSTYSFFYFTTQMHERYIHPALIFTALWALVNRKYAFYLLMSLGYFLNMEKILEFLPINHEAIVIFSSRITAVILGAGLVLGYYYLYQKEFSDLFRKIKPSKTIINK